MPVCLTQLLKNADCKHRTCSCRLGHPPVHPDLHTTYVQATKAVKLPALLQPCGLASATWQFTRLQQHVHSLKRSQAAVLANVNLCTDAHRAHLVGAMARLHHNRPWAFQVGTVYLSSTAHHRPASMYLPICPVQDNPEMPKAEHALRAASLV